MSVWTPGIIVGNELTTLAAVTNDGDVVPQSVVSTLSADDSNTVDVFGFTAPEIASLSITGVDPATFPRVVVGLNASAQNLPNWHAAHFRVLVEGQAVPVRIEEPYSNSSDVIVVHDQSGSMREEDRFAMARAFNQTLVGGLSSGQKLAVIAHNDHIRVQRLFDQLVDVVAENLPELWELSVGGKTSFLDALDYGLNAVEIDLGPELASSTSIVLVSDGANSQFDLDALKDQMNKQLARAKALNIAIYPVILSSAQAVDFATMAQETGGQLIRIQDLAQIMSTAQALARRLSGNMAISFTAPHDPVPDAGSVFNFTLEVAGHDGVVPDSYAVPDDVIASDPALFVEISAGAHRSVRPVMVLGDGYDVNAMTGRHALYLTPGIYPSDRMAAQCLNQWLFAHDAAIEDEEAMLAHIQSPAFSADHATTMNGLANLMQVSMAEQQALQYPMAALVHTMVSNPNDAGPGIAGEPMNVVTTLDVPAWSSFLSEAASREDIARIGLALNDAEARAAKLCEIDGDPRDVGKRMFHEALKEMGKAVLAKLNGKLPEGVKTAIAPPDLPGWLSDKVGTDCLTNWIDDPTVKKMLKT